jgi:hypothetical protein
MKPVRHRSFIAFVCALCVAAMLAACAVTGGGLVDNKRLATGYATAQIVAETTDQLFVAKKISREEAGNLKLQVDSAIAALDTAAAVMHDAPGTAATRIDAALALIATAQAFLATKGKP